MKTKICLIMVLLLVFSVSLSWAEKDFTNIRIDPSDIRQLPEKPNLNRTFDWYAYAVSSEITNLNWPGPERATFFEMSDFVVLYPATIEQVSHLFYEHSLYPWPDSTFHFKIYDADGTTLLHESGDLEAAHLVEYIYTLPTPLVVTDDFYVAVVPTDPSGHPSSMSTNLHDGHSYNGSAGAWVFYAGFEYITGVYLEGATPTVPVLDVDPDPYDFGNVIVGNCSAWQVFTLRNIGIGTINVSSIILTGADPGEFEIQNNPAPCSLPPDATVEVRFCPTSAGAKTVDLVIIDDRGVKIIPLYGNGYVVVYGDKCSDPYTGFSDDFTDTGATTGMINDYDEVCPYTGSTAPDVVYEWVVNTTGFYTLDLCLPGTDYDTKMYVYAICPDPGNPLACNDDCPDDPLWRSKIECLEIVDASTYYIVVDGYGTDSGNYELNVFLDGTCIPNPPTEIDIDINYGTDEVEITWTPETYLTYNVYSHTDPYAVFPGTPPDDWTLEETGNTTGVYTETPIPGVKKFYIVTANY